MKKRYVVWGFIFLLFFPTLSAQEIMTLEKCREIALENNRSAAIADRNREKADFMRKAYWANYFPKFSASGNYLYTSTSLKRTLPGNYLPTFIPDPSTGELIPNIQTMPDGSSVFNQYAYFPDLDLSLKVSGTWFTGINATQPIYTGGKITSAYRMSQIGYEIAQLNRHLTNTEIIMNTDEAYWLYVQANELLRLAISYEQTVGSLLGDVWNAVEVGLKHRNELLKVQVKFNEAELKVRQAENGVRLSRKNLCYYMGLPLETVIVLPEAIEDNVFADIQYTADYTSRPEYAILDEQVRLKEQEIKQVRSDFLPQVGVSANYGYSNGLKLNNEKLLDNSSFSVIASVSIPLFQWGEGRNKVRAAKAEREIARLQQADLNEKMHLELAQAWDKWDESIFEVALTTRSLEQADENMRVSGDLYEEGMETLSNYLEAQTNWQSAWTEHIQAKTRQRLSYTYYLKASGRL